MFEIVAHQPAFRAPVRTNSALLQEFDEVFHFPMFFSEII